MRVVAILQARMHSTRLPGKMLLPLAGAPLLERVIERVERATSLDYIVLAFPERDREAFLPILNNHTSRLGWYAHHGDENDLIARFLSATYLYAADLIVRIPCDNPCIEPRYIDEAVQTYLARDVTFYSNTTVDVEGQWIDGLGAEVFSMSRLKIISQKTVGHPDYREHIHKSFEYVLPTPALSLDVDTQADYDFIADLYDHCYPVNPQFTITDILAYLATKQVSV